jgi:hypothetical protein
MDWLQVLTIVATLIGGMFYIHTDVKQQSARTDRLYEMFIDLLKDKNR